MKPPAPLQFKNLVTTLKGGRMRRIGFTPTDLKQPLASPEERQEYHSEAYNTSAVDPSKELSTKQSSGEVNPIHNEELTEPYPNLNTMSNALKTESSLANEDPQKTQFNKLSGMLGKRPRL